MTSNYYENGYNDGYGYDWKNNDDDHPITDSDWASYQNGYREGKRKRKISDEIDRELYGEEGW